MAKLWRPVPEGNPGEQRQRNRGDKKGEGHPWVEAHCTSVGQKPKRSARRDRS